VSALTPPPARRTFELLLSYDCNAKCAFCYNPPLTKDVLAQSIPFTRAAGMLAAARAGGYDGVWLTGGDPTLRPDLAKLLLLSRKLGFRRIQIGTNAVRLADAAYASRLVAAGLNYARVSLHAATPAVHDRLLALPGAFDKALRGIENLRARGVYVGLNFVVTSGNAAELPGFFELCLGRLGVRDFDVIFLHHRGMMDLHGDELGVRYAAAVPHLRKAWKILEKKGLRRRTPTLVNVPPCVVPELEPWIADWSAEEAGDALTRPGAAAVDLMAMKGEQKTKGPACASCTLTSRCLGFEREYAARYGDADFAPIRGGRREAVR
jgi:MoaA/NifB/PqqE/SkfB family radical SAM enzyme